MSQKLFVLFEHAAGYALFRVKEFEEIGALLPQVEQSVTDMTKFTSMVQLCAHYTFSSAVEALDAMNSISEGVVPESLQVFLETQFNKASKKQNAVIGVADPKLGSNIAELLSVKCMHTGPIPEIMRGIRFHLHTYIQNFSNYSITVAQLGLGHSYSRAKIKFNVNFEDNMIIQSICLLDQLDKDLNTFSMKLREWYSYHFPELYKLVPENYLFAKAAFCVGDRKSLSEEKLGELEEIVMDSEKAHAIISAAKSSIGVDISPLDLINIQMFATRVITMSEYRKELVEYLKTKMNTIAPNLSTLLGEQVGARLISKAGSLTNLAKCPASTVQILGAEKALFRALKSRGQTPKYGILYNSSYIGKAGFKNKGRISRCLANKCSIASRIDCFSEFPCTVFGEKLKQQMEDRLKFYETGEKPLPTTEVMSSAINAYLNMKNSAETGEKKGKKKKKKKKHSEINESVVNNTEEQMEITEGTNGVEEQADITESVNNVEEQEVAKEPRKKRKKVKDVMEGNTEDVEEEHVEEEAPVKKRKKQKLMDSVLNVNEEDEAKPVKKKKKIVESDTQLGAGNVSAEEENGQIDVAGKKRKKKKHQLENLQ